MGRLTSLLILAGLALACAGLEVEQQTTVTGGPTTTTTVPVGSTAAPTTTTSTTVPRAVISGKVVDGRGEPLAGAAVQVGSVVVETGSSGWYRIIAERPGDLHISKPGWQPVVAAWDESEVVVHVQLDQEKVRGLRVSAGAAGDDAVFERLLDLADATAVNALVFDTKQEGGKVLYHTGVAAAVESGAVDPWYDPAARLMAAKERGLYAITRIVVFEDAIRVGSRPEERLAGVWVDPRSPGARDYNIELAVEACGLGFDEIQFDYVRFPAGRTARVSGQLALSQTERVEAIAGFLRAARAALQPLGCQVSADVFAIVVSVEDDQGLGQRPEELSAELHALSPMIYPSHYSDGWLGFHDPNDHPYAVTADAIDDALARMAEGAELRPWLQAFWWSNSQIREAIDAAEDRGVGWILWNVASNFDLEAIPTDEELAQSSG